MHLHDREEINMTYSIGDETYFIRYSVTELGKEYDIWLENVQDETDSLLLEELEEEDQENVTYKVNLDALEALDQNDLIGYV